jgi:sugar-specific transcriptional regulator TrmB/DNA-binding CsgD family transcriptional regulator
MLGPLGIHAEQERLYVALINRPGSSLDELAEQLGSPLGVTETGLRELVSLGLVVSEHEGQPAEPGGSKEGPGRRCRFRASSPSVALMPLVLHQRTRLDETEATVALLTEQFRQAAVPAPGGVIEVVRGASATRHRFTQLLAGARREVLLFAPESPVAVAREAADSLEQEALARGVTYRTVISVAALERPGTLQDAQRSLNAGMQVRVADRIPMRMIVCDGADAMVPLSAIGQHDQPDALIVHGTGVVEALTLLFEQYWSRARPLPASARTTRDLAVALQHGPSQEDRQLLALLALGLPDRSIAGHLGVSIRTVERRVRALMDLAEVQSRFQLGIQASLKGWLPS